MEQILTTHTLKAIKVLFRSNVNHTFNLATGFVYRLICTQDKTKALAVCFKHEEKFTYLNKEQIIKQSKVNLK